MFRSEEIEKARELKKLQFPKKWLPNWKPEVGHYFWSRKAQEGTQAISEDILLVVSPHSSHEDLVWLPTFDDLLRYSKDLGISFSMVTDFLHRRRMADGKEREGFYVLLIERLR